MQRALGLATNLFPIWVVLGGALALIHPPWFTWFSGNYITWGLAVIMLGMGSPSRSKISKPCSKCPAPSPSASWRNTPSCPSWDGAWRTGCDLETPLAVGLILVACCPAGTASNVVNYLARSNVALSVLMTMCSTFGAIVMTPLLTKWLAGTYVPVDAVGLFVSTVQIVLAPLVLGIGLSRYAPRLVKSVLPAAPLISVLTITLICASIIGPALMDSSNRRAKLMGAVFILHAAGFFLGYCFSRALRCDRITSRTISVEVGMQNSGLGAALAKAHFQSLPRPRCPAPSPQRSTPSSAACWPVIGGCVSPRADRPRSTTSSC